MAEYIEKNKIINLLEHNDKVYHYADRDKENIVNDTVQNLCRVIIEAEAANVQPVNMFMSDRCIVCYRDVRKDTAYYDINGATVCGGCMSVKCKVEIKEKEK